MTELPQSQMRVLVRTPRLVDEIVARLRDGIIDGTLPAGTQLTQVALANQLGVSRTPLREALRLLESEGLLRTSSTNQSVEVVAMSISDLRQMYELREVLDGLAARLAAERGLGSELDAEADELLGELEKSEEPYDPVLRSRAHAQFHELITRASQNGKLQTYRPLIRTSSAALYLPANREHAERNLLAADPTASYQDVLAESNAQHRKIIEAIRSGDADRAESTARAHIQRTLHLVPAFGESARVGCTHY